MKLIWIKAFTKETVTMIRDKVIYDGYYKVLEMQTVVDGENVVQEKLWLPNIVGALLIDEDGMVGLVSQYRPTISQRIMEIPAGKVKTGKSPRQSLLEILVKEYEFDKDDILHIEERSFEKYSMLVRDTGAVTELYKVRVKKQARMNIAIGGGRAEMKWLTISEYREFVDNYMVISAKCLIAYRQAEKVLCEKDV